MENDISKIEYAELRNRVINIRQKLYDLEQSYDILGDNLQNGLFIDNNYFCSDDFNFLNSVNNQIISEINDKVLYSINSKV